MSMHRPIAALLAIALANPWVGMTRADDAGVKMLRVDTTDLTEISGIDVYKWQVPLRQGQRVRVALDVQDAENAQPRNYIAREVSARKDGDATLLAGFLRADRKLASVFLSEESKMEFRLQWEGVASDGLTGWVANPLAEVPLGHKALTVHKAPQAEGASRELLLLFRTDPMARPLQMLYPRATLRLEFVAAGKDSDEGKADIARMQGEWSMVSGVADGFEMPAEMRAAAKRVCQGNETTVTMGPQLMMQANFTVDPTRKPKAIDYEATGGPTKGKTHLGIYEFDGETIKYCFAAPGAERPTDFTSQAGQRRTLSVWKKAKSAE